MQTGSEVDHTRMSHADAARSGRRPASVQNCWNPASCVLRLTCGFDVLEVLSETVAFVPIASCDVLAEAHLTSVVSAGAHGLELLVFDFSASDSSSDDVVESVAGKKENPVGVGGGKIVGRNAIAALLNISVGLAFKRRGPVGRAPKLNNGNRFR